MTPLKAGLKSLAPTGVVKWALLTFPALYRTAFVNYETNIEAGGGLVDLIERLEEVRDMPGDMVECGSARCGTAVIAGKWIQKVAVRKIWYALDSFEGFPPDELERERMAGLNDSHFDAFTSTSLEYVQAKLNRLQVDDVVIPVKGFFQETLGALDRDWCLALIDCDLKDSLLYCAETVWGRLSSGGVVLFDDYSSQGHRGAAQGIEEFISSHAKDITSEGLMRRLYYAKKA
jgi:O-methyltransferase